MTTELSTAIAQAFPGATIKEENLQFGTPKSIAIFVLRKGDSPHCCVWNHYSEQILIQTDEETIRWIVADLVAISKQHDEITSAIHDHRRRN